MILFFYVHNAKMNEWIYFYYNLKKKTLIWKIINMELWKYELQFYFLHVTVKKMY
jgi:hypothetical protein